MACLPKKEGGGLDVDRIVEAAWNLVDREGVAALSTRALAAELNVKSPALYWHVRNKQELLSLMVERVLGEAVAAPLEDLDWKERIRIMVREQRRAFLSHRDTGLILSIVTMTERLRTEIFPRFIAPLLPVGISEKQAHAIGGALASLILGWIIYEQHDQSRAFMTSMNDPDEAFEFALDAFVSGIEAIAQRTSQPRRPGQE